MLLKCLALPSLIPTNLLFLLMLGFDLELSLSDGVITDEIGVSFLGVFPFISVLSYLE